MMEMITTRTTATVAPPAILARSSMIFSLNAMEIPTRDSNNVQKVANV
jgi:hypothetical protein